MTRLADIETTLAIFAEGIAGKRYQLQDDEALADPFGHNPIRRPLTSYYNLYLPKEFNFFSSDETNRRAYLLMVLHQLGHREFGTFDFDIRTVRRLFPLLGSDKPLSSDQQSDLCQLYEQFDNPRVARDLFCVIESERIERQLLRQYPGAQIYRRELQPYINSLHGTESSSPLNSAINQLSGQLKRVPNCHSPLAGKVAEAMSMHACVMDSISATFRCYIAIRHLIGDEESSFPETAVPQHHLVLETLQRQSKLEDSEEELLGIDLELFQSELLSAMAETSEINSSAANLLSTPVEPKMLAKKRNQVQRRVSVERSSLGITPRGNASDGKSFRYDEWDYLNSAWLRNWCQVHEFPMASEVANDTSELLLAVRPHVREVRKLFEQIRPAGMKRVKHQSEGDELDLERTVSLRVDRNTRASLDDRIYSRKVAVSRDIATAILVDLSASTDSPIDKPIDTPSHADAIETRVQDLRDPYFDDDYLNGRLDFNPVDLQHEPSRRVIDVMREAVLLLATALESLDDTYAVYGFSGYGKDNVELHVAKEFNRKLTMREIGALASMEPKRSTRMGPSIRHAVNKLISTGAAMKVLLIVSDGFPQDCDYGPDRTDHEYGLQDTAMALREADHKGIHSFCVTVDHAGHDYLRRMCRRDRYLVIEDLELLPIELNRAYRRLIAR